MRELGLNILIEFQSPGAGSVAFPSPFVSPKILSSAREVKMIGFPGVPSKNIGPLLILSRMVTLVPPILTTVPGRIVIEGLSLLNEELDTNSKPSF
jgi:hypothetical protein